MWFTRSSRLKGSRVCPQELIPGAETRCEQCLWSDHPLGLGGPICEMAVGDILPAYPLTPSNAWLGRDGCPSNKWVPPQPPSLGPAASHQHCG